MSTEKLRLEVILAAIDKITGPLKTITKGSGDAARALRAAKDQLKDIQGQQKAIAAFKDADKAAAITANMFKGVQEQVKHLQREMAKTPEPTRAMIKALKDAQEESEKLKRRHAGLMDKQQQLFAQMKAGGIDVSNLATHSRDLATRQIEAARAVDKLKQSLEAQNKTLAKMHAARANYDKSMAQAGKLRGAGAGAMMGGAAMSLPVVLAAKDYATFEDAMLGVARQVEGARDANGKLTQTYHDMGAAIKAMAERIPMTTVEIAKIVEAGARMGIQGKENLLIYAQTTAVMADAFDLPVDMIGENIGKISQLYKIPIKDIKALGDTINWLDDNALAKGGDIIDVMQRMAGSATMVGMSYRQAAALGSTFLSLGAKAEVAASASNAMIGQLANAPMLATATRYREGLEMLNLSAMDLQRGMNMDSTGTIIKVLEAIKALPQEKQLEAATRLFGKEYGDDASKLAQNVGEYRRQLELVNAAAAKGSMQREADARKDAINARMTMAKSAIFNLSADLGEHLKPGITATLEKIVQIAQAVRAWAQENPALSGGIMTTVKWLALAVTGIGALLVAASAILVPIAAFKFGLTAIGITAGGALTTLWAIVNPIAKIGLAFGAGYAAGMLINEALNSLASRVLGYKTTLGAAIFDIIEMFKSGDWPSIGMLIVRGIEAGLDALTAGLYSRIKNMAGNMVASAKSALGIKSPSAVFAQIGGYTMAGLEQGIDAARKGPLGAMAAAAKQLTAAGAGLLIGGTAAAGGLPAIAPGGMSVGAGAGGNTYVFQIYPSPGMDEQALAGMIERKIRDIDAQRAAGRRSRLVDSE